ncbi:MAG: DNA double-strand break repair nuclease NurA [Chloroflexi bacterium]|nr:DNA double-strand break repair nuclease NurA [Chloroflexota bacterium]
MSLDFQQVRQQVIEMGKIAPGRERHLRELRKVALAILKDVAHDLDSLRTKVDSAVRLNPYLRCAVPGQDALDTIYPCPDTPQHITILAADGSQINPDRHIFVDYSLINVGAIQMQIGSSAPPSTVVRSQLLYNKKVDSSTSLITEAQVALLRDLKERTLLAELVADLELPIVTLTDGPLELWVGREGATEIKAHDKHFQKYLEALRVLRAKGASTAGYIDKPRGDLLIRLLEIAILADDELEKAGREHRPLRGITDSDLFSQVLARYQRSAVFAIQSRNAEKYEHELALHFFYLNVGHDDKHPTLVRVEIPAWVANSPKMLADLHAVLIQQCQILGNRSYPYLLHRSHEVAVVSLDEKRQVENMIALELRNRGVMVGQESHKQSSKNAAQQKGRYAG